MSCPYFDLRRAQGARHDAEGEARDDLVAAAQPHARAHLPPVRAARACAAHLAAGLARHLVGLRALRGLAQQPLMASDGA